MRLALYPRLWSPSSGWIPLGSRLIPPSHTPPHPWATHTQIKCMVISQDKSKGRVALSTKTLEQEPGDMIKNQEKVFENAEDTAAKYQERIAAERKAREEAAQDVIFGLESVFTEPAAEGGDAAPEMKLEESPAAE